MSKDFVNQSLKELKIALIYREELDKLLKDAKG